MVASLENRFALLDGETFANHQQEISKGKPGLEIIEERLAFPSCSRAASPCPTSMKETFTIFDEAKLNEKPNINRSNKITRIETLRNDEHSFIPPIV